MCSEPRPRLPDQPLSQGDIHPQALERLGDRLAGTLDGVLLEEALDLVVVVPLRQRAERLHQAAQEHRGVGLL
ncbi:MAG: hypothetical protein ACJ79Y_00700, partial [Myxococcales bacterium]